MPGEEHSAAKGSTVSRPRLQVEIVSIGGSEPASKKDGEGGGGLSSSSDIHIGFGPVGAAGKGGAAKQRVPHPFYCSVCHLGFFDLQSASAHKLTRRHLLNAGLNPDEILAVHKGAVATTTVEELEALYQKRATEKGIVPLRNLRRKRSRSPPRPEGDPRNT
jgi:hypothetical protein